MIHPSPGRYSVGGVNHPPSVPASLQSQDGFRGRLEITLQVAGQPKLKRQHVGVSIGTRVPVYFASKRLNDVG